MRNENGPNGLDLLMGLVVVGAFATAKTWARLQVSIGRIGEAIGHILFILVKVGAVASIIYGVYRLVHWTAKFLARVDALEGRVAGIEQKELPELGSSIDRLSRTLWSIEVDLGNLQKRADTLEEEAKKTKDTSAVTIGAVVSEIAKG